MVTDLDFLDHIGQESARFRACLAGADPSAPVPSCPDWTAGDLLWHLAEVQLFWAVIVRDRLDDPDAAEAEKPPRPDDYEALLALFDRATDALVETLSATPSETAVWTWAADQSVGFVRHWQAHEALIHRLDAEAVIGEPTAIDPVLATDGIGLVLAVGHGDAPAWGTFTPDGTSATIEASNTRTNWRLVLGRFRGTSPNSGTTYDMESLAVDHTISDAPAFTVRGSAADVDAWLWGRAPVERLDVVGDRAAFGRLKEIVGRGLQ